MKILPLAVGLLFSLSLISLHAKVAFEEIYSPHMVLQRDVELPIRGTADAGVEVTVDFAGQSKAVKADGNGNWEAFLEPIKAGGPFVLAAKSGKDEAKLEDVLVGDVWVASGQSNMAWMVRQSTGGDAALAQPQPPLLRATYIPYVASAREPIESLPMQWFVPSDVEPAKSLSGIGYFFARYLAETVTDVPIGLISVSKGGTPAESWMREELLAGDPDFKPILDRMYQYEKDYPALKKQWDADAPARDAEYAKVLEEAKAANKKPLPPKKLVPPDYHSRPVGLWNGMIHPIIKLPIKGVVWNQGVSNAQYTEVYAKLFQALIKDWRAQWKSGEFPFVFIQIERNNNYKTLKEAPPVAGDEPWAEIREAQVRSLATPNTHMVASSDQGEDGTSRHPLDKTIPAHRLANMVLKYYYGKNDLLADAPRFKSAKPVESGIEITFDNAGAGLVIKGGGKVEAFAVSGPDRKWTWADAELTGKNTVLVKVPAGLAPKDAFVRYNWLQYCFGNLYSSVDLPAEPFRTDNFPYTTAGKR